ncbi:sensor histidine kinase [Pedobacter duraquae]|uniref:histidine kinase n=1 Tax=Pedobacter duraquae TaxID=425511 RepID=A0A4R6IKD5_9SPHI|nr:ATP-binding protein [Pedobacter duraquae]TDO22507.1 histidine kinase [Pedobacter duraquae]
MNALKVLPYLLLFLLLLIGCDTKSPDLGKELYQQMKYNGFPFLVFGIICVSSYIYFLKQKRTQFNKRNKQVSWFTEKLFENSEKERKRIAADLHDGVTHELLALKSGLQDKPELKIQVDRIINEIRSVCRDLHPVLFKKVGLLLSLEQMTERMIHVHGLQLIIDSDYGESLPTGVELQIYRILQEALSNTIKYADALHARIEIKEHPNKLSVLIEDDGKGFNVEHQLQQGDAFGLHNILERSKVCGGEARITSSPKGTKINIQIPKTHG